jgi:putative Holliday junction resolvase
MQSGRRIGFDFGVVRIGVAMSDTSGLIASPLTTLQAQSADLAEQLSSLFAEFEPIYLAVGEPKHLSGSESKSMELVAEFVSLLRTITSVPIHMVDERMSTLSAARDLRATGHTAKTSKEKIDAASAVAILESALNRERIAGKIE